MRQDKAIKYLRHAMNFATEFSKDQSTKVGAFFLHPTDFTILTQGYNGMPRGCHDDAPERQVRPLKYEYFEHAERNSIFNAMRPMLRDSIVLTTESLNMSMARAIVSVGATEVWFPHPLAPTASHLRAIELFAEVGVQAGTYKGSELQTAERTRHTAKLSKYLAHARSLSFNLAKDPMASSTIFLSPDDYTVLSEGYSGMPRGADDQMVSRYGAEERQFWIEDSVRNAIYNRARPLLRGSIAIATQLPCAECARGIAAVGSVEVVSPLPAPDFAHRWGAHLERSRALFRELNIAVTEVPQTELETLFATA